MILEHPRLHLVSLGECGSDPGKSVSFKHEPSTFGMTIGSGHNDEYVWVMWSTAPSPDALTTLYVTDEIKQAIEKVITLNNRKIKNVRIGAEQTLSGYCANNLISGFRVDSSEYDMTRMTHELYVSLKFSARVVRQIVLKFEFSA